MCLNDQNATCTHILSLITASLFWDSDKCAIINVHPHFFSYGFARLCKGNRHHKPACVDRFASDYKARAHHEGH